LIEQGTEGGIGIEALAEALKTLIGGALHGLCTELYQRLLKALHEALSEALCTKIP